METEFVCTKRGAMIQYVHIPVMAQPQPLGLPSKFQSHCPFLSIRDSDRLIFDIDLPNPDKSNQIKSQFVSDQ
ncbi:hypothetical protein FH972_017436 [Carpinus fangiana]|uniref:Uncharacterized protein n=1 Tax=Carpinus fangiana TaxID=176857 RepID=A0A5N6RIX6_9ROSI|nr:hypothetical protein FH972_017436 [Carpinus fangiana]